MSTPTNRMTVTDIANLAGVQRATVSNWQKRHEDFPKPIPDVPGRPQFDGTAVRTWLTKRYPDRPSDSGRAADVVRTWRYTVNLAKYEAATPLIVLIAAITGDKISYGPSGDERYPVKITVDWDDTDDTTLLATESEAAVIREFLQTQLNGVDEADLIDAVTREVDDFGRWRRTPEVLSAEQNLYDLIAELVPDDANTVLDFACGTGALLAAASGKHPKATVTGMEPDPLKASTAQARLKYRGEAAAVEDVDILESDPLGGRTFDAVISIPPFGRKVDAVKKERMRALPFGAVRGVADAAWPQLAAQALNPDGKAFLVLPHTVTVDDRADHIRRELIRQGLLSAVVTLPPDAHPSSKGLLDLWVLDHRRERAANVLMVDYSYVDLSYDEYDYASLSYGLHNWLNGRFPEMAEEDEDIHHFYPDDAFYEEVDPISLLGPTVILDPQYWCVRKATSTGAADLITAVDNATTDLTDKCDSLLTLEAPDCRPRSHLQTMITIREARDEKLLQVVRRTSAAKNWPTLTVADADAMRHGGHPEVTAPPEAGLTDQPPQDAVCEGDVLVWATRDRPESPTPVRPEPSQPGHRVRAAICTVTGLVPESAITILRCGPNLDPSYVALALAAARNAVHTTGSTIPTLRVLELSLPRIPIQSQRQIAEHTRAVRELADAARTVAHAADAFEQALSDAVGSGLVGFAGQDNHQ